MPRSKRPFNANRSKRLLTREELLIWEAVTQEDEKLEGAVIDWGQAADDILSAKPENTALRPSAEQYEKLLDAKIPSLPHQPKPSHITGSGIDYNSARRLRRGKLPVEAILDLHGMGQEQAKLCLGNFIVESYQQGFRVVQIITGKGRFGLGSESGILRRCLPKWLVLPPCEGLVLSFNAARQKDGGDGAFYVLLRRSRK